MFPTWRTAKYFTEPVAPQRDVHPVKLIQHFLKFSVFHVLRCNLLFLPLWINGSFLFALYALLRFLSLLSILHSVFHSIQRCWPHRVKNCCYYNCLNMNGQVKKNLGRLLRHFQVLNCHLVKQYYHIPPSVHPRYTQAVLSHSSISSPSVHTRSTITFLHLFTLSKHKQYHHIPPSVHPQYSQAVSSHSSICSPSVHTSSIITFHLLFTLRTHKQYHHIPPSVNPQYSQAVLSHSSISSPSVHTSSIITFLHLFTISTHKQYHHIPTSVHPQYTQAVSSHSSICSPSVLTNTDDKALEQHN